MSSTLAQFNYQFFRGGGQRLTLEEARSLGEKDRPWIFLHGLMGYGRNWQRIVSGLGPHDVSLTYDQRGHGQSWKPERGYSPEDYATDLNRISEELGWTRFLLVGHSMGGRNALVFTARHGEKVEKLIIEDIGPESQPEAVVYFENLFASIPTPFPSKKAAKEFMMNEFSHLESLRPTATLGLYLYSNIVETPEGTADWRFSRSAILESVRAGRARDHWAEFRSLSVPTLVLRGDRSDELSSSVFHQLALSNPRIETAEVVNAGHWIHSDQPVEFIRLIKEFADRPSFERS